MEDWVEDIIQHMPRMMDYGINSMIAEFMEFQNIRSKDPQHTFCFIRERMESRLNECF